jgi:hypothetical protein
LLLGSTAISPSFVIHSGSSAPSINIVYVLSSIAPELSVALSTNFDSVNLSTSNGVPTMYNPSILSPPGNDPLITFTVLIVFDTVLTGKAKRIV